MKTETQGDCHVMIKTEIEVMQLQTKEPQRLLAIPQKLEFPCSFQREYGAADT